jgi:thiol:disulfide interchange protein
MRIVGWCLGIATLAVLCSGVGTAPAQGPAGDKVQLKTVKLDGLKDLIKQQKGKVVVVDFWADT